MSTDGRRPLLTREAVAQLGAHILHFSAGRFRAAGALPGNPYGISVEPFGGAVAMKARRGTIEGKSLLMGVTCDELGRLDDMLTFFRSDAVPFTLFSFDDDLRAAAWERLHHRGLHFRGTQNLLVAAPHPSWPELPDGVEVAELGADGLEPFLDMFYQAHGSVTERESEERPFERAELQMAGHHLYRLRVDGQDAAIASMFVHGGVASSLSATVLPAFRRRGLQRLLIEWRCAHARELGCELLTASASRFGESHRNLERCGFGYWCFGSQWSEEAD